MRQNNKCYHWRCVLMLFVIVNSNVYAQKNYIREYKPYVETLPGASLTVDNSLISTSYFDNAGRLIQTVNNQITPQNFDMANFILYDGFNRKIREWSSIPLSSSNGDFKPLSMLESTPYNDHCQVDYEYELSLMNRVVKETGKNIPGKSIHTEYLMNDNTRILSVHNFQPSGEFSIKNVGVYVQSSLNCIKKTDEDGGLLYVFTDSQNKIILERRTHDIYSEFYDTYYIYDEFGNLFCVLPPAASDVLNSETLYSLDKCAALDLYAYFYKYDNFNNIVAQKFPGIGWYYTVFDGDSRPILIQSPNQRQKNEWKFIKYDGLSRVILEGTVVNTNSNSDLINYYKTILVKESFSEINEYGYTENIYLGENQIIDNVYYYDNYDFLNLRIFEPLVGYKPFNYYAANSLNTGNYTRVLNSEDQYQINVQYYDKRARTIEQSKYNTLSSTLMQSLFEYDFSNKLLSNINYYYTPLEYIAERNYYTYDRCGRLLENNLDISLYAANKFSISKNFPFFKYSYDEFSRISETNILNKKELLNTQYRLDGKLQETTSSLFSQQFTYEDFSTSYGESYNNGRISSYSILQNENNYCFHYAYDPMNRLISSMMFDQASNRYLGFKEELGYDKMSNLTFLYRKTPLGDVNTLSYTYKGNQLVSSEDYSSSRYPFEYKFLYCKPGNESNSYNYDLNGNEVRDMSRDMEYARYNRLNLPDSIVFRGGNRLEMLYLANGRRLSTISTTYRTALVVPIDDIQNHSDPVNVYSELLDDRLYFCNGKLSKLYVDGGYISFSDEFTGGYSIKPYYYITDYLGSVRFTCDGNRGTPLQSLEYLPSGAIFRRSGYETQNYRFCGKEELTMHGYDMYDSEARFQYSKRPGFSSIDPLCEKYYSTSPYVYCSGDPVNFSDPDGKRRWPVNPTYNGYGKNHANNFGEARSNGRTHKGVDINYDGGGNTDKGAPIIATHDGTITRVVTIGDGDKDGGGNRIQITSSDGNVSTYYMHLDAVSDGIKTGTVVTEGQQIGTMGGSGSGKSDEYVSHLHYEIKINGIMVDPATSPTNLRDPQKLISPLNGGTLEEVVVTAPKTVAIVFIPEIKPPQLPNKLTFP